GGTAGPGGPGARRRKRDHGPQPGLITLERKAPAMEVGDGQRQAQAEARARLRAALLEPHEAFDRTRAISRRNPWTIVSDSKQDTIALAGRLDLDLRRPAGWCRGGRRILD